jgi:hypothetical protein
MPDTPETLTRRYHRAAYDEKVLQFAQETLSRSRELLEKTKFLVSPNPAGSFIGARQTDSGKCDFESEAGKGD